MRQQNLTFPQLNCRFWHVADGNVFGNAEASVTKIPDGY
jgi:hypothetical protein